MKKIIVFTLLMVIAVHSFCQQTNSQDYLQKSKHQKTAAWIMLGGGVALGVAGAAVDASNWYSSGGDVLLVIGGAAIVSSVPLFIAAGKNKKKSTAVSGFFKMEKAPVIRHTSFAYRSYPAVSIKINL
jgi:hypothetical protein